MEKLKRAASWWMTQRSNKGCIGQVAWSFMSIFVFSLFIVGFLFVVLGWWWRQRKNLGMRAWLFLTAIYIVVGLVGNGIRTQRIQQSNELASVPKPTANLAPESASVVTEDPAPTATEGVPVSTATEEPTATATEEPEPTITRTPKATRTPRPTNTPDPLQEERQEYDEFFDEVITNYNSAFNLFRDLNQQWVDTSGGIAGDDTWAFSVSATTLDIENISHRILRRNYPSIEKLVPFHTELRLSAIRLDVGMNLYRIGLDNFDVDKVELATDLYLLSYEALGVLNKMEKSNTSIFPLTPSLVVDVNTLNVRSGAGAGYDTVDTLSLGNIVPVMRYTLDGTWLEVATFNDKIGWVSTDYVVVQGSDELEKIVNNRSSSQGTTSNNNPQPFTCIGGCASPPDPSCSIKGNINPSSGTWIYHTTSSSYYSRTDINLSEGDRWFCTTQEAINAGFRAPNR